MSKPRQKRDPYFWEALVSIFALIIGIASSIVIYGADPHIPMLIGTCVAAFMAYRAGYNWEAIEKGMLHGIGRSLQAIVILLTIGILIGVWISSGVVPTLLYYGLNMINPSVFLPACVIICSIASLATGTSWGTTGTIGIALMGIGSGLGFPLPMVAGAVLSGAYFGDKMSPLSDTTNLAAAMAGTDLYSHIRHMMYTTGVSIILTLILDTAIGLFYGNGAADLQQVQTILTSLDQQFNLNPLLLLPPLLVMVCAYKKAPAIPGIIVGIISAAVLGIIFQGNGMASLLSSAFGGYVSSSGIEAVDTLLSKGGLSSMDYTVSIIICAMMFGGVMEETNQLKVILKKILSRVKSNGSLVTSTVLTCIGANLVLCDQYMAVIMGGRMFSEEYRNRGLDPKNLSRAVEDSATVTANLVPWNSGGAYQAATLGVATIAYMPFAFFNWISPLVTLAYAWFDITITPLEATATEAEPRQQEFGLKQPALAEELD